MDIPVNEQQSAEQTILLNAIRNKFANNENNTGTSPPVFTIPNLKFTQFSPPSNSMDSNENSPASKLNTFILSKLGESTLGTKNGSAGSFQIPDLKIQNNCDTGRLTLAEKLRFKNNTNSSPSEIKINALNKDITNLHLTDEQSKEHHVIDLTTALNQRSTFPPASVPKEESTYTQNPLDFHIPFIDCDLKDDTLKLPLHDEHCLPDVSGYVHRRFISAPSRFGKITCLKYRLPKISIIVDHSFVKKHKITQFGFDTKSPDDIVSASLRRNNRV